MLGLLHLERYGQCPRCGGWVPRGRPCASCDTADRDRYARPRRTEAPQEDLSIALCPGLSAGKPHWVMRKAITETGRCHRCDPPTRRTAEPRPSGGAVATLPDAGLPRSVRDVPGPGPLPAVSRSNAPSQPPNTREEPHCSTRVVASRSLTIVARPSRPPRRSGARDWLLDQLKAGGGEVDAGTIAVRAVAAGISPTALRYVKERLPLSSVKTGMRGKWVWRLFED